MEGGLLSISRILFIGNGGIETSGLLVGCSVFILVALYFLHWFCTSSGPSTKEKSRLPRFPKAMPPVFPNGWIPVMESTDLGVGDVKSVRAFGEDLVVFRTQDGVAHVADAYCPHLGAHLGVMGRVVGDCIECPFHGWRFRGEDGVCSHVPYSAKVPDFAKMKTWQSEEIGGLVFAWYHAEGEPPSWLLTDIPEIACPKWDNIGKRNENVIYCHIQELVENSADVGHFDQLHGPSCLVKGENFSVDAETTWWGRLMYHRWETAWTSRGHLGTVHVVCKTFCSLEWLRNLQRYEFDLLQIGPALVLTTMRTRFGNVSYILSVTPEKPFQLRVVHRYFPDRRMPRLFFLFFVWASKHMFERDVVVWNSKAYMKNPALVKEDRTILSFRKWFSQFYSSSSPTWEDIRDKTLQW
ncbi:conserved hypothetical protein [Ixodes scapularis]|uniref:cholesterol 7-desaturase n=1 Tax=Ixodes scapularis TaxID=6945 RepID=B7Q1J3_IXOSC|nr:conserved hypothetical protein [Ixodes scapularis]|eukprot:XP_002409724.1 conserved hypothetical protein [Ixodes scapularis]